MTGYTIAMLITGGILLIVGVLIVTGVWNPFSKKDADGKKEPLSRKEKGMVAGFFAMLILAIVNFFYAIFPMQKRKS